MCIQIPTKSIEDELESFCMGMGVDGCWEPSNKKSLISPFPQVFRLCQKTLQAKKIEMASAYRITQFIE
jgi:hypothetical protein